MILNARHRAREIALQILYRNDVVNAADGAEEPASLKGFELPRPIGTPAPVAAPKKLAAAINVADDLRWHFEHFNVSEELRPFAAELVAGTLAETARIDGLLEKAASNWKVGRMSVVDRSLLRLAVAEMIRFPETSVPVVIDEAVELAKQFGNAESPAFINGVLDAIKKQIRA